MRAGHCNDSWPLRHWKGSYASDYVGFSILLVLFLVNEFLVDPFHRLFFVNDLTIAYPHAEVERVPVGLNFVYALFVPLFLILLYNTVRGSAVHKHHVSVLGLAIALVLTCTLTDIIKNMVGRPRPDLLARCQPAPGTPPNTLVSYAVCTQPDHQMLHDGWRSFPSGHSSFAFAGLGYMSLFLAGQLRIFVLESSRSGGGAQPAVPGAVGERGDWAAGSDEKPMHVRGDLSKVLLCLAPLLGAALIAISRCQDYRHDVYDVCVGALLGWVVAYWSYRRYWPHLSSPHCDEPYPGPTLEGSAYGRLRDEEEGLRRE